MNTPLTNALAMALVHFLWEGAALALLLVPFQRASARVRYAVACAVFFAMPLAFGVTLLRLWESPAVAARHIVVPHLAAAPDATASAPATAAAAGPIWHWLAPIWMAGVAIFYLRSFIAWMSARRMQNTGVVHATSDWQQRFLGLRARAGVSRAVALVESCLTEVPVVIGYFRPVILLPAGMATGLSTDQVEALLLHELAHIRRHDYLVNLLQTAVEGLLFYHPAVWWVSHVIRTEREHCCDDAVVAQRGDARGYAGALAALEMLRAPETALAATGGSLVRRVRRLLRQPEGPQGSPAAIVVAAVLLAGAAVILPAWQQGSAQDVQRKQDDGRSASHAAQSPYRKWLTEDVAYIITNEERVAFRSLSTDEQRERFVQQFWERRDPTPGTPENEFKEEHYRRIAYANENFQDAAGLAGWKTDRGRVYIVYGPPDEKESHPNATPPNEQWLYRHIEGVGDNIVVEFVNEGGGMRMMSDPHGPEPKKLFVRVGGSEVIDTSLSIHRVTLSSGTVAEAVAVNPRKLRIEGKQTGVTSLVLWLEGGNKLRYEVTVEPTRN
jgi:GWxTD domain-containing protein